MFRARPHQRWRGVNVPVTRAGTGAALKIVIGNIECARGFHASGSTVTEIYLPKDPFLFAEESHMIYAEREQPEIRPLANSLQEEG